MKILWKHYSFFLISFLVLFGTDILTKWLIVNGKIKDITFIKEFFYLSVFHKNEGIAFGIGIPLWIQIVGSITILLLLLKIGYEQLMKNKDIGVLDSVLLGCVAGGGLGNLLDRIMNGYVVDFIVLGPIPVFNVADMGITIGLFVLFGRMMLFSQKYKN